MQRRGTATVAAAATSSLKTNINSSSSAALATNNNGGGGCGDGGDDDDDAINERRRRRRKKTRRASSRYYSADGVLRLLLVMVTLGGGTLLLLVFYSAPQPHSRLSVGDNYKTRKQRQLMQGVTTGRDNPSVGGDNHATAAASNTQQQQQQIKHSMDEQQQQRRRRNKSRINSSSTAATDIIDTVVGTVSPTTNTTLHIIFSTDCTTYQRWQSYLFFYSAYTIGQPGYITRIVSGCNDDDDADDASGSSSSKKKKKKEDEELQWHNIHVRHEMSDRYRIHFTPKFSTVKEYDEEENGDGGGGKGKKEYKFFNKPFGLLHFLENNDLLGTTTTTTTTITKEDEEYVKNNSSTMTMMKKMIHPNDIIILVDPDFLLLRPITDDFSNSNTTLISKRRAQFYNQQRNNNNYGRNIVTHGQPYAQAYGLGTQWRKFNISHIAGHDSPAKDVSQQDGFLYYPVGPPYIATARDMYHIAMTWSTFVIRVHDEYPHLLAEMFAYCIAVAHLHLPHVIIDSLMITTAGIGGEGWKYINNIPSSEVCIVASNYHNTRKTYHNSSSQPQHHTRYNYILPNAIHYCQSYTVDKYMFSKRRVPHDIFTATCNHPLLVEPPMDLGMGHYSSYSRTKGAPSAVMSSEKEHMEAFMVCALTYALNNAMKFFMEHSSSAGNTCIVDERNRNKAYSMWEGGLVEI